MADSAKDEILDSTLKSLFDQAFKDGVVTDNEFKMIEQIEIGVDNYLDGLNKALLDNIITPEESLQLEKLKDSILADAEKVASADGEIDEEEQELLLTLTKILKKYRTE